MKDVDLRCRICGSKDIYCIQETYLKDRPWAIIHVGYCRDCSNEIERFEIGLVNTRKFYDSIDGRIYDKEGEE